jgi:general secretion pathway protein D
VTLIKRKTAKTIQLLLSLTMLYCSSSIMAQELTMNMRNADIRALIQWISDSTGKNIIVHKAVEGNVTVLSPSPVTPEEAYQVFLSVLQVHGYAAIETDQALKIVPVNLAKDSGLPVNGDTNSDMIVSVIKVANVDALKLTEILRPLVSSDALISSYAPTNSLVIADHRSNIESVKQLVARLDQSSDSEIDIIKLNHADAAAVVISLNALNNDNSDDPGLSFNISADERSNSIMLSGNPAKRKQYKKLISQLDTPLNGQGNTQVIYLHYINASEVAPILKSLIQSIKSGEKDTSTSSIEASESANAIVINASPSVINTMKRVIADLDIRRAQVLIEAMIVEVSGEIADDYGVTWLTDSGKEIISSVNTLGDLAVANITEDGSFSPAEGATIGYFQSGDIQAAIRALTVTQNTNILSTPSIVAIDNEEASLLVGQNVPFKTGQSTSSAATVSDPFTTIERQDIGISLTVTPRINQGDSITMEIKQTTESIAPSVESASDLITNKREIITRALIKDNEILVLGGLISDEETEVVQKVPFLGSLPLVGKLFSSTGKSHNKKNLMIFIHPTILKDEEHSRQITQRRYNFMKDLRQQVNDNDWKVETKGNTVMEDFNTFSPVNRASNEAQE